MALSFQCHIDNSEIVTNSLIIGVQKILLIAIVLMSYGKKLI